MYLVYGCGLEESRSLGLERKVGGKCPLKLNTGARSIAYKYLEGKMKRTLKRELEVPETAGRQENGLHVAGCGTAVCFVGALSWSLVVVGLPAKGVVFPTSVGTVGSLLGIIGAVCGGAFGHHRVVLETRWGT